VILPNSFYCREDVLQVSRELLGKVLCTDVGGVQTKVVITETEAYAGITDRASHAFGGKRTKRTEPMFASGGNAYVYLCYGIHNLFNVVTNVEGVPHAVLIRAGNPVEGVDIMLARRQKSIVDKSLLGGPGSLAKALGITTELTGRTLQGDDVWIEDHGISAPPGEIDASPRVGVDYAGIDAQLPYRFRAKISMGIE
jgi:DNA-3-methyladenine glycosylase